MQKIGRRLLLGLGAAAGIRAATEPEIDVIVKEKGKRKNLYPFSRVLLASGSTGVVQRFELTIKAPHQTTVETLLYRAGFDMEIDYNQPGFEGQPLITAIENVRASLEISIDGDLPFPEGHVGFQRVLPDQTVKIWLSKLPGKRPAILLPV
jgi:hypothetical protein